MDFIDQLKLFATRADKIMEKLTTEEATKTSLIMPFFQLLGYDIFNPHEFVPEFTADVGIKKGEKVDYAILKDGKPMILIEAKWSGDTLQAHDSQLFRYFTTTSAKFAILTNGLIYKFYTDLEEQNKMDEKPFLEFNLLDIKESLIPELKKFQKDNFDLETILNSAEELKYSNQIKQYMAKQLASPTDTFVGTVIGEFYTGRKTQVVIDKFRDLVRRSMNQYVNELMNEKIKTALENEAKAGNSQGEATESVSVVDTPVSKIITTQEELEGYAIVKTLLREVIKPTRLTYKDTETYFGVLVDNNTRKWVCRLDLNGAKKCLYISDKDKNPTRHPIASVDDIFNLKKELTEAVSRYV